VRLDSLLKCKTINKLKGVKFMFICACLLAAAATDVVPQTLHGSEQCYDTLNRKLNDVVVAVC